MSVPHAVIAIDREHSTVLGAYGPFDEDEAGAICAWALRKGAEPGDLQVVELQGVVGGTFSSRWQDGRYWTLDADQIDNQVNHIAGVEAQLGVPVVGIVDEGEGGVIAYVPRHHAGLIVAALEARYGRGDV